MNIWKVGKNGDVWQRHGNSWFAAHMSTATIAAFLAAQEAGAVDYE